MRIHVKLKLFASLRKYAPGGSTDGVMELEQGTRISQLLDRLGIEPRTAKIILRNARHAEPEDVLADGDVLAVFPPLAGG